MGVEVAFGLLGDDEGVLVFVGVGHFGGDGVGCGLGWGVRGCGYVLLLQRVVSR